jgi:hypothetical protein
VAAPAISPDGRLVAFTVTTVNQARTSVTARCGRFPPPAARRCATPRRAPRARPQVLLPICELWLASDSPGSLEEPFRFALEEGQKLVVRDRSGMMAGLYLLELRELTTFPLVGSLLCHSRRCRRMRPASTRCGPRVEGVLGKQKLPGGSWATWQFYQESGVQRYLEPVSAAGGARRSARLKVSAHNASAGAVPHAPSINHGPFVSIGNLDGAD